MAQYGYENGGGAVSIPRETDAPDDILDLGVQTALEIDAEHQPRLMPFEIDQIKGGTRSGRASPGLNAPAGGQPRALRELEIRSRADEQRLACELLHPDAFVSAQISRFRPEKDARTQLRHHSERNANGGSLLRRPGAGKTRPFRLIDQIDSRDGNVRDHIPIERQRELGPVISDRCSRGLVDTVGMAFHCNGQPERSRVPIQKPVAEIDGHPLPGQLAAILKTRNAVDIVSRERASNLNPKIPGGHEFQFEFLADRPVPSAIPGESSGRLALEFALADVADIRSDHEAKQMLGINALGVNTARKQPRKAHHRRPERLCTGWHSHSESHG